MLQSSVCVKREGGVYHRTSRNNVNVEQAGDRCFVKKEAERQTAEEDRARVTDISLTPP